MSIWGVAAVGKVIYPTAVCKTQFTLKGPFVPCRSHSTPRKPEGHIHKRITKLQRTTHLFWLVLQGSHLSCLQILFVCAGTVCSKVEGWSVREWVVRVIFETLQLQARISKGLTQRVASYACSIVILSLVSSHSMSTTAHHLHEGNHCPQWVFIYPLVWMIKEDPDGTKSRMNDQAVLLKTQAWGYQTRG